MKREGEAMGDSVVSGGGDRVEEAAVALAGECLLRLSPAIHLQGACVHVELPGARRLRCYGIGHEPPEGSRLSAKQAALDEALRRPEGG